MKPATLVFLVLGAAGVVGLTATVARTTNRPADEPAAVRTAAAVEPHWQLFLDDHVIERSTGFRRVVHSPKPHGVVLEPDQPWETQGLSIMHVGRRRDGKFECYYRVHGEGVLSDTHAYALSDDGIHWTKPDLGLVPAPGGGKSNLLPCGAPFDVGFLGTASDPSKRYLLGLGNHPRGFKMETYFAAELPDWQNDPKWKDKLVRAGTKPSYKLGLNFWDEATGEWVFMRQSPNHPPTRCIARWSTRDLKNWAVRSVLYPDANDSSDPRSFDEAYGMHAVVTEGLVLGFIEWFKGDQTRSDLAVLERELIGRVHMKGPIETRIAVSRDGGFSWDRTVSREAWIPHGTETNSYDRLVVMYASPVRNGDEDWIYATVIDGDHASGMGYGRPGRIRGALYTQKHNRYVSLQAGNTAQILITRPIRVTGRTLQLNVDGSRGEVKVGIGVDKPITIFNTVGHLPNYMVRDRQDRTHLEPGFRIGQCRAIHANSIEHTVEWKDSSLQALQGKTVRLYIMVRDANVFGFRFNK